MFDEDYEEEPIHCGVCGRDVENKELCYEIRYGILSHGRFEANETYMIVHAACLKE